MLSCIAAVAIAAMVGKKTYESQVSETNNLLALNVEALTNDENGNSLWFSNLRTVECTLSKVNGGGAFYYKGVLVAAGATYTYYGSKRRCEREFTINTCNTRDETACS